MEAALEKKDISNLKNIDIIDDLTIRKLIESRKKTSLKKIKKVSQKNDNINQKKINVKLFN